MYKPPIEIESYDNFIEETSKEFANQIEKETFNVIQRFGIVVDREELIKALRYDRDSYTKGYNDALKHVSKRVSELIEECMIKTEEGE